MTTPEHRLYGDSSPGWDGGREDAALELRLRMLALPVTLAVAWLLTGGQGLSQMLSRIFLAMWIHELGHATSAWLAGFFAFPGPWRTMIGDERSIAMRVLVGALLATAVVVTARSERYRLTALAGAVSLVFVVLAFVVPEQTAKMIITFSGDGGAMVIGALLTTTFFVPDDHPLKRGWLRWGFLVIGAVAYCDATHTWLAALHDAAEIPFGRIDGVGFSDPLKLVEEFAWSERALISRYLTTSALAFALMFIAWAHGVVVARAAVRAETRS